MNLICHTNALPVINYLLDEDEEVVGFKYFETEGLERRFLVPGSKLRKPKSYELGVKQHSSEVEMLCRIRDFLVDGLELAQTEVGTSTDHSRIAN